MKYRIIKKEKDNGWDGDGDGVKDSEFIFKVLRHS
jgi:hypothetical protein